MVTDETRREFVRILGALGDRGARVAVLACTEIGYLFRDGHEAPLELVDSTSVHAEAIAEFCLGDVG